MLRRRQLRLCAAVVAIGGMTTHCASTPSFTVEMDARVPVAAVGAPEESSFWRRDRIRVDECAVYAAGATAPRTLWRIRRGEGEKGASEIRYGVVPEGFEQVVPSTGAAPALRAGVRYVFSCGSGGEPFGTSFEIPEVRTRPTAPLERREPSTSSRREPGRHAA